MKSILKQIPILGDIFKRAYWRLLSGVKARESFPGSAEYWEKRYSSGGNSGVGSYAFFAEFKAEVLNRFVAANNVQSIIEFGCGDGNQLKLATYPNYLGLDVSKTAIANCQQLFRQDDMKSFRLMGDYRGESADLAMSLDVIYHLVEDPVFEDYMATLFRASNRFVVIYASDTNDNRRLAGTHVKHRKFTEWIRRNLPNWRLLEHLPNRYPYHGDYRTGSFADFFIFEKSLTER